MDTGDGGEDDADGAPSTRVGGSTRRRRRIRSVASWVLLVVSTILVVVATTAWWVHATVLDTDRFMAIIEPAVTSEAFDDQLSGRLADATTRALDLETRLEARLSTIDEFIVVGLLEALEPGDLALDVMGRLDLPRFADLAGPISAALDGAIAESIDGLVRSERFETTVVDTIRRTHRAAVTLMTDDLSAFENVYVTDEGLTVDLLPLVGHALRSVIEDGLVAGEELEAPDLSDRPRIEEALERIGTAVGGLVPDDLGQVTVMSSQQYETIRGAARSFDRLVWAVTALTLVSIAATVWVAPRRRRAVVRLAVAVLLAIGMTAVLVRRLVVAVQAEIADAGVAAAADAFLTALNGSLSEILSVVVWLAVGIGLVAYLLGRPPWLADLLGPLGDRTLAATDVDRTVARNAEALAAVGAAVVLGVAWVTGLSVGWTAGALVAYGIWLWWIYGGRGRVRATDVDGGPVGALESGGET